jgi:hypothetical protein
MNRGKAVLLKGTDNYCRCGGNYVEPDSTCFYGFLEKYFIHFVDFFLLLFILTLKIQSVML